MGCLPGKPKALITHDMSGVQKFNRQLLQARNRREADNARKEIYSYKDLKVPQLDLMSNMLYTNRLKLKV
jgi:hypothetical protein